MEKICGACSQEKGMSKEKRIEIALSRMPNEVYHCPVCKADHFYQVNASKKVILVQPPKQTEAKPEKKPKKKKENKPEQLALF